MIVQIAAEELGLTPDDVQLISADTEVTPSDPGSYSMCETFIGGNAVRLAAQDVKKKLFRIVADEFGVGEEKLSARNRKIFVTNDPQQSMSIAKAVRMALTRNESISGEGSYWPKVDWKREWVKNPYGQLSETFSFGTVICEVKVDSETGQVEVLEVTASQDVGYALNPKVIEGQFEGGVAMGGQGGMLTEYLQWHEGRVLTPTQLGYLVPLAIDMPKINTIIVETIDPKGPYGAKEAGMSVAMSAAQAYCGAISNALGVYFHEYPITPDKILKAIEEKKKRDRKE
jgi:4-hydroxybenzoyl-CoA reductase subunit alpha